MLQFPCSRVLHLCLMTLLRCRAAGVMSTLSNAPLLASLADEALLHGSTGPQAGCAEDASSQPPASPAEKGAPRPTARWYLGEVDALRLHIPVKSAKGLMELRWALGQKPPEHLTIIADQLPVLPC